MSRSSTASLAAVVDVEIHWPTQKRLDFLQTLQDADTLTKSYKRIYERGYGERLPGYRDPST